MPQAVPTDAEFQALRDRVVSLEASVDLHAMELADLGNRVAALENDPPPDPLPDPPLTYALSLLDLSSGQLPNLGAAGQVRTIVKNKTDGGSANTFSVGIGEGVTGGNALKVHVADGKLPSFWLLRYEGTSNVYDSRGYFSSEGTLPYNRLSFWVKTPQGFRASYSTVGNTQNWHVGTYHFDPGKIGSGQPVKESDNYHFYCRPYIRHDKAGDEWVHVVLNELPTHQRSWNLLDTANPTKEHGNFWEILTRFYVESVPYVSQGASPEISGAYEVLFDRFELFYVPPKFKVEWSTPPPSHVPSGSTHVATAKITNLTTSTLDVIVRPAANWHFNATTNVSIASISPGAVWAVDLTIAPHIAAGSHPCGILVVDQQAIDGGFNQSFADPNVERRHDAMYTGATDGHADGCSMRIST